MNLIVRSRAGNGMNFDAKVLGSLIESGMSGIWDYSR
jgi:hypothetical protein